MCENDLNEIERRIGDLIARFEHHCRPAGDSTDCTNFLLRESIEDYKMHIQVSVDAVSDMMRGNLQRW